MISTCRPPIAKRIVDPVDEPLSIAEVRMHLRNPERTDNDSELIDFIKQAREQAEHKTGRALMPQTWEVYLDRFPCVYSGVYTRVWPYPFDAINLDNMIELPRPPLIAVTSVKYLDADEVLQTIDPADYVVDVTDEKFPRLRLPNGGSWPTPVTLPNAVTVRYTAGYADASLVPFGIKNWMKCAIEFMHGPGRGLTAERELHLSPFAERMLDASRTYY